MATMAGAFLVFNSGSSSFKFSVFDGGVTDAYIYGQADQLNTPQARIRGAACGEEFNNVIANANHHSAIQHLITLLSKHGITEKTLAGAGHRVVHGGEQFSASALITPSVINAVEQCIPLAPLHNPASIDGIKLLQQAFPELSHIAVFDTAFHQTLPEHAYLYGLPYDLYEKHGIRRYGFHGTSYRYISEQAVPHKLTNGAHHHLLVAHLGNGCSACAISGGKSLDTTMGLTPLEGMVMGSRSGSVDPGLGQFLQHTLGWSQSKTYQTLNTQSGLLGVSGVSNCMRELLNAKPNAIGAQRAIALFCYRAASEILRISTALPQVDALIFTGGIGENAAPIREQIVNHLQVLNIALNPSANIQNGANTEGYIGQEGSIPVWVLPTNEERMIALDCKRIIQKG